MTSEPARHGDHRNAETVRTEGSRAGGWHDLRRRGLVVALALGLFNATLGLVPAPAQADEGTSQPSPHELQNEPMLELPTVAPDPAPPACKENAPVMPIAQALLRRGQDDLYNLWGRNAASLQSVRVPIPAEPPTFLPPMPLRGIQVPTDPPPEGTYRLCWAGQDGKVTCQDLPVPYHVPFVIDFDRDGSPDMFARLGPVVDGPNTKDLIGNPGSSAVPPVGMQWTLATLDRIVDDGALTKMANDAVENLKDGIGVPDLDDLPELPELADPLPDLDRTRQVPETLFAELDEFEDMLFGLLQSLGIGSLLEPRDPPLDSGSGSELAGDPASEAEEAVDSSSDAAGDAVGDAVGTVGGIGARRGRSRAVPEPSNADATPASHAPFRGTEAGGTKPGMAYALFQYAGSTYAVGSSSLVDERRESVTGGKYTHLPAETIVDAVPASTASGEVLTVRGRHDEPGDRVSLVFGTRDATTGVRTRGALEFKPVPTDYELTQTLFEKGSQAKQTLGLYTGDKYTALVAAVESTGGAPRETVVVHAAGVHDNTVEVETVGDHEVHVALRGNDLGRVGVTRTDPFDKTGFEAWGVPGDLAVDVVDAGSLHMSVRGARGLDDVEYGSTALRSSTRVATKDLPARFSVDVTPTGAGVDVRYVASPEARPDFMLDHRDARNGARERLLVTLEDVPPVAVARLASSDGSVQVSARGRDSRMVAGEPEPTADVRPFGRIAIQTSDTEIMDFIAASGSAAHADHVLVTEDWNSETERTETRAAIQLTGLEDLSVVVTTSGSGKAKRSDGDIAMVRDEPGRFVTRLDMLDKNVHADVDRLPADVALGWEATVSRTFVHYEGDGVADVLRFHYGETDVDTAMRNGWDPNSRPEETSLDTVVRPLGTHAQIIARQDVDDTVITWGGSDEVDRVGVAARRPMELTRGIATVTTLPTIYADVAEVPREGQIRVGPGGFYLGAPGGDVHRPFRLGDAFAAITTDGSVEVLDAPQYLTARARPHFPWISASLQVHDMGSLRYRMRESGGFTFDAPAEPATEPFQACIDYDNVFGFVDGMAPDDRVRVALATTRFPAPLEVERVATGVNTEQLRYEAARPFGLAADLRMGKRARLADSNTEFRPEPRWIRGLSVDARRVPFSSAEEDPSLGVRVYLDPLPASVTVNFRRTPEGFEIDKGTNPFEVGQIDLNQAPDGIGLEVVDGVFALVDRIARVRLRGPGRPVDFAVAKLQTDVDDLSVRLEASDGGIRAEGMMSTRRGTGTEVVESPSLDFLVSDLTTSFAVTKVAGFQRTVSGPPRALSQYVAEHEATGRIERVRIRLVDPDYAAWLGDGETWTHLMDVVEVPRRVDISIRDVVTRVEVCDEALWADAVEVRYRANGAGQTGDPELGGLVFAMPLTKQTLDSFTTPASRRQDVPGVLRDQMTTEAAMTLDLRLQGVPPRVDTLIRTEHTPGAQVYAHGDAIGDVRASLTGGLRLKAEVYADCADTDTLIPWHTDISADLAATFHKIELAGRGVRGAKMRVEGIHSSIVGQWDELTIGATGVQLAGWLEVRECRPFCVSAVSRDYNADRSIFQRLLHDPDDPDLDVVDVSVYPCGSGSWRRGRRPMPVPSGGDFTNLSVDDVSSVILNIFEINEDGPPDPKLWFAHSCPDGVGSGYGTWFDV